MRGSALTRTRHEAPRIEGSSIAQRSAFAVRRRHGPSFACRALAAAPRRHRVGRKPLGWKPRARTIARRRCIRQQNSEEGIQERHTALCDCGVIDSTRRAPACVRITITRSRVQGTQETPDPRLSTLQIVVPEASCFSRQSR